MRNFARLWSIARGNKPKDEKNLILPARYRGSERLPERVQRHQPPHQGRRSRSDLRQGRRIVRCRKMEQGHHAFAERRKLLLGNQQGRHAFVLHRPRSFQEPQLRHGLGVVRHLPPHFRPQSFHRRCRRDVRHVLLLPFAVAPARPDGHRPGDRRHFGVHVALSRQREVRAVRADA